MPRTYNWQRDPAELPSDKRVRSVPDIDRVDVAVADRPRVRMRLADQDDVARQLKRLYGMVMAGEIDAVEAGRRARVLKSLAEVLTTASIERRLASIERAMDVKRKGR